MVDVILLFVIQGAIGLFDIVYHHELKERLPWRRNTSHELRLHGARNVLYIIVYLSLGWLEFRGLFAWILMLVLAAEAAITFRDFVVEDRTRTLPPSERIIHAVMTLNYGLILALYLPEVAGWAHGATELRPVDRGVWSWVIGLYMAGLVIWSVRDLACAARAARRADPPPPVAIGDILARPVSVLVTGGTGFIGGALGEALSATGHRVTVLTRDKRHAAHLRGPITLIDDLDQLDDGARFDAIVNLAGESLAEGRWTRRKMRRIVRSRLDTTRALVRYIARARHKPRVMVSGSAIGYYGDGPARPDEPPARGFAQRLCRAWEAQARRAEKAGVRVCLLRTGIVLGTDGGALARMLPAFDLCLGGRLGDGRQWMSWIHIDDIVRLIVHVIAHDDIRGAVNATAPMPVRNAEFTAALARAMRRPAFFHLPAWALRLSLGRMADEILLSGPEILPRKAQGAAFRFRHPMVQGALADILGRPAAPCADYPRRAPIRPLSKG